MTGKNKNYTVEELEALIEGRVNNRKKIDKNLDKAVDDLVSTIKNPKMRKKRKATQKRNTGSTFNSCGSTSGCSGYATITYRGCGGGGRC